MSNCAAKTACPNHAFLIGADPDKRVALAPAKFGCGVARVTGHDVNIADVKGEVPPKQRASLTATSVV